MNPADSHDHDPFDFEIAPTHPFDSGSHLHPTGPLDLHHTGHGFDLLGEHHDTLLDGFQPGTDLAASHAQALGGQIIGEPGSGNVWHEQQTSFTCAVVSQEMILREFGLNVNEAQLMGEAMQHHWLNDSGTQFADMGKLLELHGVPCHDGQGIDQMVSELSQGHKVIVAVDSTDLWQGDSWIAKELHEMVAGGPQADHAVVVQGLRHDDDGSWHVIVNDSGNPNGEAHDYPLDQFTDAWKGSNCHFVATEISPPGLATHPVYGQGYDEQSGTYSGVMDWLHSHSSALHAALLGSAILVRRVDSSGRRKSENERNDLLREI